MNFTVSRWNYNTRTDLIDIYENSTVKAYDLDYGGEESRFDLRSGSDDTSYIELYYDDGLGSYYTIFKDYLWRITEDSHINKSTNLNGYEMKIVGSDVFTKYELTNISNLLVKGGAFTIKGTTVRIS
jgi:hypothetical protein